MSSFQIKVYNIYLQRRDPELTTACSSGVRTSAATTASAWACTWGEGACWQAGRLAEGPGLHPACEQRYVLLKVSNEDSSSSSETRLPLRDASRALRVVLGEASAIPQAVITSWAGRRGGGGLTVLTGCGGR